MLVRISPTMLAVRDVIQVLRAPEKQYPINSVIQELRSGAIKVQATTRTYHHRQILQDALMKAFPDQASLVFNIKVNPNMSTINWGVSKKEVAKPVLAKIGTDAA